MLRSQWANYAAARLVSVLINNTLSWAGESSREAPCGAAAADCGEPTTPRSSPQPGDIPGGLPRRCLAWGCAMCRGAGWLSRWTPGQGLGHAGAGAGEQGLAGTARKVGWDRYGVAPRRQGTMACVGQGMGQGGTGQAGGGSVWHCTGRRWHGASRGVTPAGGGTGEAAGGTGERVTRAKQAVTQDRG